MNRIDRLHAIAVHLQSKKRVKAQEIADRFGLSLRTVYRDIRALDESGIPVIGEAGSGYTIMDGYRLPPVMFTPNEASALLVGSKLVGHFTDSSLKSQFESAMFKIKAVLRKDDRNDVEVLDERIAIDNGPIPLDDSLQLHFHAIRNAIVNQKIIRLSYFSTYKEELTTRDVEPIGLVFYSHSWHFIAWCRLRDGYRDFRIDRVKQLQVMDEGFDPDRHPVLKEYLQQLRKDKELTEAVIVFEKEIARYMQSQKYYYGFVSQEETGGKVRMKFLSQHPESLARWLLMYTNLATIESPQSLRDLTQEYIKELNQHYNDH